MRHFRAGLAALAIAVLPQAAGAQEAGTLEKVTVGVTRAVVVGSALTALEKGYFKEAGLDVDVQFLDASASAVALLATNQFQVIEGAPSASFFNGLQQGLPVRIVMDTVSTPIGHRLIVRSELKDEIRAIGDLKGRKIGINAPNSIVLYEMLKLLQSDDMTIADIETQVVPFTQMPIAFKTGAIDAAILIPPWVASVPADGLGFPLVTVDDIAKPTPMSISVTMLNTDWAKEKPEVAQRYITALLRGVRDYCTAFHNGATRAEVSGYLVKHGIVPDAKVLDLLPWNSRNPDGRINPESLLDVQAFYVDQGLVKDAQPIEAIYDPSYAEKAVEALGPYKPDGVTPKPMSGCMSAAS